MEGGDWYSVCVVSGTAVAAFEGGAVLDIDCFPDVLDVQMCLSVLLSRGPGVTLSPDRQHSVVVGCEPVMPVSVTTYGCALSYGHWERG